MTLCYLGLGSNLRSPERQLRKAIILLRTLPRSIVTNTSKIYQSLPWGVRSQPPYCNMVVAIHTSLSAQHLLMNCHCIEATLQRVPNKRWGARTLDIDLLLYGKEIINQRELTVPHPRMINRDFVLVPLLEIAPEAQLPSGEPLANFLPHCDRYLYA